MKVDQLVSIDQSMNLINHAVTGDLYDKDSSCSGVHSATLPAGQDVVQIRILVIEHFLTAGSVSLCDRKNLSPISLHTDHLPVAVSSQHQCFFRTQFVGIFALVVVMQHQQIKEAPTAGLGEL